MADLGKFNAEVYLELQGKGAEVLEQLGNNPLAALPDLQKKATAAGVDTASADKLVKQIIALLKSEMPRRTATASSGKGKETVSANTVQIEAKVVNITTSAISKDSKKSPLESPEKIGRSLWHGLNFGQNGMFSRTFQGNNGEEIAGTGIRDVRGRTRAMGNLMQLTDPKKIEQSVDDIITGLLKQVEIDPRGVQKAIDYLLADAQNAIKPSTGEVRQGSTTRFHGALLKGIQGAQGLQAFERTDPVAAGRVKLEGGKAQYTDLAPQVQEMEKLNQLQQQYIEALRESEKAKQALRHAKLLPEGTVELEGEATQRLKDARAKKAEVKREFVAAGGDKSSLESWDTEVKKELKPTTDFDAKIGKLQKQLDEATDEAIQETLSKKIEGLRKRQSAAAQQ